MADTNVEFCAACGRKVALNAQFCAWCGANLGATEEQNVQQDAVTGEDVVGWASGVFIDNRWIPNRMLLFTTDRTVVAYASERANAVAGYKDELHRTEWQAERIAFDAETIKMLSEYVPAQELHDDLPVSRSTQIIDELLSENKENYTIPYSEITQLRVTAWCVT